jgi:Asp-tRNA(Asn)/Glu-tRNA(Gln) amidotransferase C subunit
MASSEDVTRLAALARLRIPEGSLDERAAEFDRIVS